jgi:Flp pilus assembly protein CpaB
LKRTNRLILLIGVVLAVVAFVGIIVVFNNQSSGGGVSKPPTTTDIVVATRDIALGEIVTKDSVGTKPVPNDQVTPDEFVDTGKAIGQVARQNILNGATLVQSMFTGSGAPMIGSDLPAGMRAMAVRVDAVTGVGSLILPGDRVDVVITLKIKVNYLVPGTEPGSPPQPAAVPELEGESTKVILQNVEVRAVLGAAGGVASTGAGIVDLATNQQVVILGVTPQQAEVLEFVGQTSVTKDGTKQGALNNLTLVLRSPTDKSGPDVKTTGIVLKTLISDYGVLPPAILEASLPPTK